MNPLVIKVRSIAYYIIIITIAFLVAFRGNTRDTIAYSYFFNNIRSYEILDPLLFYTQSGIEWGFGLLAYSISFLTDNVNIFFFIVSFLTTYSIYLTAKKLKLNFLDVLFVYTPSFLITQQLMQIRQGLATGLAFLAIATFLTHKKKAAIFVTIAGLIHQSSFIIAPVLLAFTQPLKKFWYFFKSNTVLACISIVITTTLIGSILTKFLEQLSSRASVYVSEDTVFSGARNVTDLANLRDLLLLVFFLFHRKILKNNNKYFILLFIYCFDIAIRIGLRDNAILSGRLGIVFGFAEIFLIPLVLIKYTKPSKAMFLIVYFIITLYITLYVRVPFMLEDYFTTRLVVH